MTGKQIFNLVQDDPIHPTVLRARSQNREADTYEYEGRECPVLWRRGGVVYIEVELGIRKEVRE